MIIRISILLIFLLTISCVTTERFERQYSDWVGFTAARLVEAWGKPQQLIKLNNGITEYSYNLSNSKKKALPNTCILTFIVNKKGIITGIKHKGNYCRKGPGFV